MNRGACCWNSWSEFDRKGPLGGRRELPPRSCPLTSLCLGAMAVHPSPQWTMNAQINKWILDACEKTWKKTRVLWPQMLENHEIVLGMCFCVPLRCSRYKGIYSSRLDFVTCVYAFMENHVFTIPCLSTSSGLPLWLCLLLTWLLTLRI